MSTLKPSLFIGSAGESLEVAHLVLKELSKVADCKIWTRQFEIGNSAYEDLCAKLALYDYGVLIAGSDDVTISKKVKKTSPRDNVIFEFGLFVGRLGRSRAFFFAEEGVKIPSDLSGITLPKFKKFSVASSAIHKKSIIDACKKIRDHIKNREKVIDYGYLPSASLAFGYFNNFVLKAISNLIGVTSLRLDGDVYSNKKSGLKLETKNTKGSKKIEFKDVTLCILIPDDLSADMFDKVRSAKHLNDWKSIKIDAGSFRPFDFHMQLDKSRKGILHLSDIPITLNALNDAIQAYIGRSHLGKNETELLLEKREIRTFKKVLDHLISENAITKNRVVTELVDI
jgi:hypothetical protein